MLQQGTADIFTLCPRPSIRCSARLALPKQPRKKKKTIVERDTPRPTYACDAAIPPTLRPDTEADCLLGQNESAATIRLLHCVWTVFQI